MTGNDYIKSCNFCSKQYQIKLNLDGSARKALNQYCSPLCCKKDKRRNKLQTLMCKSCGNEFKQTTSTNTHYCSSSCKVWACKNQNKYQYGPVVSKDHVNVIGPFVCSPCVICSVWVFRHPKNVAPLCSDHIGISAEARLMLSRGVNEISCRCCGVWFCTLYGLGKGSGCVKHCSPECAKQSATTVRRSHKAKRRAVTKGVDADSIDPIRVFERDKWICHLCKRKTYKDSRGSYHPRAPELEHIVALADGGTHTWGNVACSCRQCNQAKGSLSIGQLGLAIAC